MLAVLGDRRLEKQSASGVRPDLREGTAASEEAGPPLPVSTYRVEMKRSSWGFRGNRLLIQGSAVVLEEGVEPSCPVKGAGF